MPWPWNHKELKLPEPPKTVMQELIEGGTKAVANTVKDQLAKPERDAKAAQEQVTKDIAADICKHFPTEVAQCVASEKKLADWKSRNEPRMPKADIAAAKQEVEGNYTILQAAIKTKYVILREAGIKEVARKAVEILDKEEKQKKRLAPPSPLASANGIALDPITPSTIEVPAVGRNSDNQQLLA